MVWLVSRHCDQSPNKDNVEEDRFTVSSQFQRSNPWSAHSIAVCVPWAEQHGGRDKWRKLLSLWWDQERQREGGRRRGPREDAPFQGNPRCPTSSAHSTPSPSIHLERVG